MAGMKQFLARWAINTMAVLVAVYIVPGIHYGKPLDLLVASLILGILNAFLRPFLMFLALMIVIGVLVSDLALMALDPRIRLQGGVAR